MMKYIFISPMAIEQFVYSMYYSHTYNIDIAHNIHNGCARFDGVSKQVQRISIRKSNVNSLQTIENSKEA